MHGTLDIAANGTEYTITVGHGGTTRNNGGDSSIGSLVVAIGGGAGMGYNQAGNSGGSGGGGGYSGSKSGNINTSIC